MSGVRVEREQLGGFTHRTRPAFGMRPTLRFTLAAVATVAYVGLAVWVSRVWRGELEDAIGPVMGWVIPILMAYIPGIVIGFLCFTLIFTRYQPPPLRAPEGPWPSGSWPDVTVIIAAYNEQEAIGWTLDHVAASTYPGALTVVLADNNSADRTAELALAAAERHHLDYRRSFEPVAGKDHALNTALVDVTTPIVVTVDADTGPHPEALTYLIARLASRPQEQHVCACAGALIAQNAIRHADAGMGLPAGDQRGQAHAGRVQQRAGRAGSVPGVLDRRAGATNAIWVWNPIASYDGSTPLRQLFPGAGEVDWVAVDGYNWGSVRDWGWQSFADIFAPTLRGLRALAPGRPVMIAETASAPGPRRAAWVTDTLRSAHADGVGAVVWFEFDKETDWRLAGDPASAAAAHPVLNGRGWRQGSNLAAVERLVVG